MTTRGLVFITNEETVFNVYYNHCDSYPTHLGYHLIRLLKRGDGERDTVRELGLQKLGKTFQRIMWADTLNKIYPEYAADAEWIYVIRLCGEHSDITIYRTCDPYFIDKYFVFLVFHSYRIYLPHEDRYILEKMALTQSIAQIALKALQAYHKAFSEVKQ